MDVMGWKRTAGGMAVLVTALFWYSGAGATQVTRTPSSSARVPASERALYATYCASCHGPTGHGDGPVAEALRVRPSDLTQLARGNGGVFPAEQTRRIIDGRDPHIRAHGTFEMPVWGDAFSRREGLSEAEVRTRIEAIVRYLDSMQERTGH